MASTPPVRTELADTYPNPSNATFRTGIGKMWDSLFGTGSIWAPWTSQSVTVTPSSGTFTSASANIQYVKQGRTVHFMLVVTIITNGTGAGSINVALPWTAAMEHGFAGRESQSTGFTIGGTVASGSATLALFKYDTTYAGGDSRRIAIGGTFQATS